MFSETAEYALRVVVFLGTLRGEAATTSQIAAATRVPEGYLAKILQSLSRARIVRSQRARWRFCSGRDPSHLTVYNVTEAIAPLPRLTTCPLDIPSHGTKLCPLHRKLDEAMRWSRKHSEPA